MNKITVRELINVLSELPDRVKEMQVHSICGCVDGDNRIHGFQFQLIDENCENKYILVPQNNNDTMYDSFGERRIR